MARVLIFNQALVNFFAILSSIKFCEYFSVIDGTRRGEVHEFSLNATNSNFRQLVFQTTINTRIT